MVLVFGTLRFPPAAMTAVRPHLETLVEATLRHDGAIAYDVAEDIFDPGLIRFSERWPDSASLARHLQASHIEPWRVVCRSLGLMAREFTAYEAGDAWQV